MNFCSDFGYMIIRETMNIIDETTNDRRRPMPTNFNLEKTNIRPTNIKKEIIIETNTTG